MTTHPFREIDEFLSDTGIWFWESDDQLRLTYLSKSFEQITGLKREDYLGRGARQFGDGSSKLALEQREKMLEERRPFKDFKWPLAAKGKPARWLKSSGAPFYRQDRTFGGYRGTGQDVTEEMLQKQENLRTMRDSRINQTLLSHIGKIWGIGAWTLSFADERIEWSDETYDIYEIPRGTHVSLERALAAYDEEGRKTLEIAIAEAQKNGSRFDVTVPFTTEKGRRIWVRSMGLTEGEGTTNERIFGTFQDVTEEREERLQVEAIAMTDSLTGVSNRHAFNIELERRLRDRALEDDHVILCFADLDRFKEINDLNGHSVGDQVLKFVADYLRDRSGEGGFVARVGGDEFAVIFSIPAGSGSPQEFVGARFDKLEHRLDTEAGPIDLRLSVGFATGSGSKIDGTKLTRNADFALHSAKASGTCTISEFDPSMADTFHRRVVVAQQFQKAVEAGEVVPHYQPIVELATGRLSGLEALARWNHPTRGVIAPSLYMQVFDDNRICVELGQLMLTRICEDMERWQRDGIFFGRVGYNTTGAELKQPGFALNILNTLAKHGLQTHHLVLEITETTMFNDVDSVVHNQLEELRNAGVSIALDDFGTGYSSLTHLKSLPFNILKIDKSFVKDVMSSDSDKSIIRSLIDLGRDIGYTTVAEGIELQAEVEFLRSVGCERGQGYLFEKPKSAHEIVDFLGRSKVVNHREPEVAA